MASPIENPSPADAAGATKRISGPAVRLAAILAVLVVALTALDRFLAGTESAEVQSSARSAYRVGSRLLRAGKANEAVETLRTAHALVRENIDYELALVTGLTDAGRTAEADPLMDDALAREPNDGQTNLIAARLAAKKGNPVQAASYYHRAIYGEWPDSAASRRLSARMELVDLLASKEQKQELLAELISLQAEASGDSAIQGRLAKLFMTAGAPGRAAQVFRDLIAKNPEDSDAYAGLGEAELEDGQYRDAHTAYFRAFLHRPNDASIRARLELLNTVTALDPTPRQLPTAEKYRRSLLILGMTRSSLEQCMAKAPGTPSGETQQWLAEADAAAETAPARVTNELAEKALTAAEKLWRARVEVCGPAAAGDTAREDPLRLIMEKLAT
jgi:Tfp pilus assembly protein PilF